MLYFLQYESTPLRRVIEELNTTTAALRNQKRNAEEKARISSPRHLENRWQMCKTTLSSLSTKLRNDHNKLTGIVYS